MRWNKGVRLMLGAALLAAALVALVSVPGFVSDLDSTVPMHPRQEARQ